MRVGALTNTAAHNTFQVVRTGPSALRVLTSIPGAAAGDFCRERRDEDETHDEVVRNSAVTAHKAELGSGHNAHKNVGWAQQTVRSKHVARRI